MTPYHAKQGALLYRMPTLEPYPHSFPARARIEVTNADIASIAVDAICNSASRSLLGGGGVDGAIRRAAGPKLAAACRKVGFCAIGSAVATPGYNLPSSIIIHTAAPRWRTGSTEGWALLASCYESSLMYADSCGAMSVGIPAIGCGCRGFPPRETAQIAVQTITNALSKCRSVGRVLFVCRDPSVYFAFSDAVRTIPVEIATAEEWLEDWQEIILRQRHYWIRIYGFMRQHWAAVAENDGQKFVAFFDDYGAVFDEIPIKGQRHERAILEKLGFERWGPGTETTNFIALQQARPHRGTPNHIYSKALKQKKIPPHDWP